MYQVPNRQTTIQFVGLIALKLAAECLRIESQSLEPRPTRSHLPAQRYTDLRCSIRRMILYFRPRHFVLLAGLTAECRNCALRSHYAIYL